MTQLQAMKAAKDNGISLEGSLGGWLFDGLSWGVKSSSSKAMEYQWKIVSKRFVQHAGGTAGAPTETPATVHAHVLMGVPANSVLYTTEWDTIKEKMKNKQVSQVVIHRYVMDGADGSVHEHDKKEISGLEAWQAFVEDSKRKDSWESSIVVKLGTMKTARGEKTIVARLSLYMNDEDWRTIKYQTIPSRAERESQQGEEGPKIAPQDPLSPDVLSRLYSSRTRTGKDTQGNEEYEMLGMQNLVQKGQMGMLHDYEAQLWSEGQVMGLDGDSLARLKMACQNLGR